MIRHIVLVTFKPEVAERDIATLFSGLSGLVRSLDGAGGFMGGRSESPEQMERGYSHAFVIDFDDWAALTRYSDHPEHRALGAKIVENAVGGRDGILVLDLDIPA